MTRRIQDERSFRATGVQPNVGSAMQESKFETDQSICRSKSNAQSVAYTSIPGGLLTNSS
jgi:hypothetical protein